MFLSINIGLNQKHPNTADMLKQSSGARLLPPHSEGFVVYLRHVLNVWDHLIEEYPTQDHIMAIEFPPHFYEREHCLDIDPRIQHSMERQKFKIKRFSFDHEQKPRRYYVAAYTDNTSRFFRRAQVKNVNSLDALDRVLDLMNRVDVRYLGKSVCSRGRIENVEVPEYARQCGIASILSALCFNDAETKRQGGQDLDTNRIWSWITTSEPNNETRQWSQGMKQRMQTECQTITYVLALLPDISENRPLHNELRNKAFVYGALAANYQNAFVWGQNLLPLLQNNQRSCNNPLHVDQNNPLNIHCYCTNIAKSVDTQTLMSTFYPPYPDPWSQNPLIDFATQHGLEWWFCRTHHA